MITSLPHASLFGNHVTSDLRVTWFTAHANYRHRLGLNRFSINISLYLVNDTR